MFALDAVSGKGSYGNICKVLSTDGGKLAMLLPPDPGEEKIPEGIMAKQGQVGVAFNELKELGFVWSRLLVLGLKDGGLKAVSSPSVWDFGFASPTLLSLSILMKLSQVG